LVSVYETAQSPAKANTPAKQAAIVGHLEKAGDIFLSAGEAEWATKWYSKAFRAAQNYDLISSSSVLSRKTDLANKALASQEPFLVLPPDLDFYDLISVFNRNRLYLSQVRALFACLSDLFGPDSQASPLLVQTLEAFFGQSLFPDKTPSSVSEVA